MINLKSEKRGLHFHTLAMTLLLLEAVEENLHEEMKNSCSVVFSKMRNLSLK